jgi:hypothetical protein
MNINFEIIFENNLIFYGILATSGLLLSYTLYSLIRTNHMNNPHMNNLHNNPHNNNPSENIEYLTDRELDYLNLDTLSTYESVIDSDFVDKDVDTLSDYQSSVE